MRVRISAAVMLLVLLSLVGVGAMVYAIESRRVDAATTGEVQSQLNGFAVLARTGQDSATGKPFRSLEQLFRVYVQRNVPDGDEVTVGWIDGEPGIVFPRDGRGLATDPAYVDAAAPLVGNGGTARFDTDDGVVYLAAQPVRLGDQQGALVVACYMAEDQEGLGDTMRTYTVVAALSLLLVTGVAFWQAGRLLAPLRTLRDTAERISETDLSRRIPETGNDDITALTRTVNGMLERLELAFVGQRQFLDDAGHELRTPLTVLRGHLELLSTGDPVEVAETRELLLDEVDRMSRLVGDLILLAKSNRPDFLAPAPVDLTALTVTVLAKARGLGDRTWLLDDTATGSAVVDEQRLTQALLALADNAVKHTAPGGEIGLGSDVVTETDAAAATATSAAAPAGGTPPGRRLLRLWVRDDGPGVPVEDRALVFERFGRSRPADGGTSGAGDEGFGLGLSIVAAIAEAHGGGVHVEDADPAAGPGSGALFVVTVPLQAPPDAPDGSTPARPGIELEVELADTRPLSQVSR